VARVGGLIEPALAYMTETALLERVAVSRGISRTMRLAGARPSNALVTALSWWLLTAWFALVGEAAGQGLVGFVLQLGQPFGELAVDHVTPYVLGGVLVAQPLHAVYRLLLYVDVRTRLEGWDLQVALRAAGMAR
jgi:hypothetical protein